MPNSKIDVEAFIRGWQFDCSAPMDDESVMVIKTRRVVSLAQQYQAEIDRRDIAYSELAKAMFEKEKLHEELYVENVNLRAALSASAGESKNEN